MLASWKYIIFVQIVRHETRFEQYDTFYDFIYTDDSYSKKK